MMKLDRKRAELELERAGKLNPGKWTDHSRYTAQACENIAARCDGMSPDTAYCYGLLHDIGRYAGPSGEALCGCGAPIWHTACHGRAMARMKEAGCSFVVASGNQYYQLRDLFPGYDDELSFVAENGAFVKDRTEIVFAADMLKETVRFVADLCEEYPEIQNVMCGLQSAYCQRGSVSREFFGLTKIYCHRLEWADDFRKVDDQILKFAATVPEEKTYYYYDMFRERLESRLEPTTSGHGAIDLILPGCHKASGLKRLAKRRGISPEQCAAFGDGGNDIEMLKYIRVPVK